MLDLQRYNLSQLFGRVLGIAVLCGAAVGASEGCSSDSTPADPGSEGGACPAGGGPLEGTATSDCMAPFQEVGACTTEPVDGGAGADQDGGVEMLPEPSVGSSNYDDDCKYRVSFTNDCVQKGGTGTTFTVTLTSLTNNMAPVPGAQPYIEASLSSIHPAGGNPSTMETSPGVYTIGPIVFDASGKWTVRFHFFGDCSDVPEDSPHAHAAFFINVP